MHLDPSNISQYLCGRNLCHGQDSESNVFLLQTVRWVLFRVLGFRQVSEVPGVEKLELHVLPEADEGAIRFLELTSALAANLHPDGNPRKPNRLPPVAYVPRTKIMHFVQ